MDRTLVLHLKPTPEQAKVLKESLEQHTACFNAVACLGWMAQQCNGVELHKQTYYELRASYPDLPAQLVCAARVKATEAVKSALTWRKKRTEAYLKKVAQAKQQGKPIPCFKPVKMPHSRMCAIRYDARSYWVKWETGTASLSTIAGRIELGFFRLKRKLQAKGTKSAKRHLKRLSRKQFRQRKDHDHVLSKRIVQHTPAGATLVLENLKHIRESSRIGRGLKNKTAGLKRRFHTWSFAQLYGFLEYKAAWCGIMVVKVDPRHTSQTCSRCGYQHRANRLSQSLFFCRNCGYRVNADYNAAQYIRNKYVASLASIGTSIAGGLLVSKPIVSTDNG